MTEKPRLKVIFPISNDNQVPLLHAVEHEETVLQQFTIYPTIGIYHHKRKLVKLDLLLWCYNTLLKFETLNTRLFTYAGAIILSPFEKFDEKFRVDLLNHTDLIGDLPVFIPKRLLFLESVSQLMNLVQKPIIIEGDEIEYYKNVERYIEENIEEFVFLPDFS